MAVKLISVRCPDCGARLDIEEGRTQCFCSYCGTKIFINNENEYVYRQVDEARIKESENEKLIKMRQLDMEERQIQNEEKLFRTGLTIAFIMFIIAQILALINIDVFFGTVMWVIAGAMFSALVSLVYHDEAKKNRKK